MKFETPSWQRLDELAFKLAQQICSNNCHFDRIVTLAKGGWPMTRSLVDYLEIEHVASIGIKFYAGINQRLKTPIIYQELPVSVKNEHVLLFDDVADTGESLIFAKDHLLTQGVKSVTTATLCYKPHSKITPDYFAATTEDWIIFPYDAVETIKTLSGKWKKESLSQQQITEKLLSLGIREDVLNWFTKQKGTK